MRRPNLVKEADGWQRHRHSWYNSALVKHQGSELCWEPPWWRTTMEKDHIGRASSQCGPSCSGPRQKWSLLLALQSHDSWGWLFQLHQQVSLSHRLPWPTVDSLHLGEQRTPHITQAAHTLAVSVSTIHPGEWLQGSRSLHAVLIHHSGVWLLAHYADNIKINGLLPW